MSDKAQVFVVNYLMQEGEAPAFRRSVAVVNEENI
jgi:hypothetical protein